MEINIEEIFKFLEKYFGIYNDKNFYIELRAFGLRGERERIFFEYMDVVQRSLKIAKFLEKNKDKNIYFSVLPRVKKEGTKEAVKYGRVLWLDFDLHDLPVEKDLKENVRKKFEEFKKKIEEINFVFPNLVIYSGKGFQCFWFLSIELSASDIEKLEERLLVFFKRIYLQNIDTSVKDVSRIMRLPFTYNMKYEKPIKVEIWNFNTLPTPSTFFKEYFKIVKIISPESKKEEIEEIFKRRIRKRKRDEIVDFFSNFWVKGYRNQLEIFLLGILLKNGIKKEHAMYIIKKICERTGDEEMKQRMYNVDYHYSHRVELFEKLKGISGLCDIVWEIINSNIPKEEFEEKPLLKYLVEQTQKGELIKDDIEFLVKNRLKAMGLTKNIFEKKSFEEIGLTLNDLREREIEDIDYWVYPIVPKGSLICLAGTPASFKSLFSLALGISIATGKNFLEKFKVHETGKVVYIDAENGPDETARRVKYLLANEVIPEELGSNFLYIPYKGIEEIEKYLRQCDNYDIVIFDSMRRFMKGDEAKSEVVNDFYMKFLKPLKERGKTIILIHHLRKKKDIEEDIMERIRGSTDIVAMLDLAFVLSKVEEEIDAEDRVMRAIVNFLKAKERSGVPVFDFNFLVEKDDKIKKTEMVFREAVRVMTKEERVKEKIAEILKTEGREMETKELMSMVSEELGEEVNKTVFSSAINRLIISGTVIRVKRGRYKYNEKLLEKFIGAQGGENE